MTLFVGLMSGTSMDGIDAALMDVEHHQLLGGLTLPYSPLAQARLNQILTQEKTTPGELCQLHTILGREFAKAVQQLLEETNTSATDIKAIGSHGQTICHDAFADIPYTLQLACPHTIAAYTNITVVADFRTRDMVLGGQGAPFAPLYHRELFASLAPSTAVVNIGGIANLTVLTNGECAIGYDVGPGNCLMDAWIAKHQAARFDYHGAWAASGQIIESLLNELLNDAYFSQTAPKSIGKEYFSLDWLSAHFPLNNYPPQDVQATLLALSATCIAHACQEYAPSAKQLLLCGGGAHNQALVQALQSQLPLYHVTSTARFGVDPDYLEAMLFAWLASKTLSHQLLDLSQMTGSSKPTILGAIYPI